MREAGTVLLAATVLLGGCGGDSNEPTPFDPAAMSDDFDAAGATFDAVFFGEIGMNFQLAASELGSLTGMPAVVASASTLRHAITNHRAGAARDSFVVAAKALLRSRTAMAGSAVILPSEVLGSTYVWDATAGDYVRSDRSDASDDGVRFILYALDPVTEEPAAPLNELGYVELRDLSTASADVARIVVVSQGTTYFDYRVSASGSEAAGSVDVTGFVSNGDDRINFDLGNDYTSGTSDTVVLDWELEFASLGLTLSYDIRFTDGPAGSLNEWDASLRGPNGYVDMTGTQSDDGTVSAQNLTFEVNGEEFAVYSCDGPEETCSFTDPSGAPLTEVEAEALDTFWGFAEGGAFISMILLRPAGMFLPL